MASVWVARLQGKHGFQKLVAVKTILPRYARDPKFHQMFLDEARIASLIQHVNVGQILDLGEQDGVMYIAMEWIEGEALSKLAQAVHDSSGEFPAGIALRILADVCAGLHAAHELRDRRGALLEIVHRDVSPHNILISDQGVAKIIDFGIAKARDRLGGDTETGSFKGKVRYVAPEQALSPRDADRRADIWAVGAVLYYLLAGRSPYAGDNDVATLTHLTSGKPPSPLPPRIPAPVRTVTNRALAWHPEDRPATAAELARALEQALGELGETVTSADVAAFCAKHVIDRTEARKAAIAAALSVADERAWSHGLAPDASSGALPFGARPRADSVMPTIAGGGALRPSGFTSPTLGSAGTMTTSPAIPTPPGKRWRVAAGLGALAVVGVASVVLFGRHKEAPPAIAAVAPSVTPPATATAASTAEALSKDVVASSAPSTTPSSAPSAATRAHTPRRVPVLRPSASAHDQAPAPPKRREYGF
jgi:serine/threonine-protein kinase